MFTTVLETVAICIPIVFILWFVFVLTKWALTKNDFFWSFRLEKDIEKYPDKEAKEIYALNKKRFWVAIMVGYVIIFLLIYSTLKFVGIGQKPFLISFISITLHFILSWINVIGPQERGFLHFWGKPLFNLERGVQFAPFGFCKIEKLARTMFEQNIPTTADKIYRSTVDESDFIPLNLQTEGYKHPIRVTFAGFSTDKKVDKIAEDISEAVDPFGERLTAEMPGIVYWSICDPIKFWSTIGSIEKAMEQIEGVYVKSVTTHLPKVTLEEFYKNRKAYDSNIFKEVDELTDKWGVKIDVANIKEPKQSHSLNAKIIEMANAKAQMRADKFVGIGLGEKEKAILKGRTEGYLDMAEKLGLDPIDIFMGETAKTISKNTDTYISVGSGGMQDLMGMIVAMGATSLKQKKQIKKESEEGEDK